MNNIRHGYFFILVFYKLPFLTDVTRSTGWGDPLDSIVVSDLHLDITSTTSDLGACEKNHTKPIK